MSLVSNVDSTGDTSFQTPARRVEGLPQRHENGLSTGVLRDILGGKYPAQDFMVLGFRLLLNAPDVAAAGKIEQAVPARDDRAGWLFGASGQTFLKELQSRGATIAQL